MTKYIIKLKSKNISCEWWGQQWCQNIGKYADYSNRLERGRTYLRKGAVESLELKGQYIIADVKGSYAPYYNVVIEVDPVADSKKEAILEQIKDISALSNGIVSHDDYNLFTVREGLFPETNEIRFDCTCPDCASMCKHIAAVLYSFGSILDKEPLALFKVRGIDVESYLDNKLYVNVNKIFSDISSFADSERTIGVEDIEKIFGIDVDLSFDGVTDIPESDQKKDDIRIIEIDAVRAARRDETRVRKSTKNPPKQRKPKETIIKGFVIRQYSIDGKFIKQFNSYDEIEKEINVSITNVKRACAGIRKSCGGYQWKKMESTGPLNDIPPVEVIVSAPVRPINCYDDEGNLIAKYESIAEAVRKSGVNSKSIRDAASGKQKHAGGFIWKYLDRDQTN